MTTVRLRPELCIYNKFIGVGAGPVWAGPLEQHSNPTHGLHVLLAGPLFEAVLRH